MYTVMVDSGHKEGFPCGFCRGYGAASREVWVSSLGQMAIAFPIPLFLQCIFERGPDKDKKNIEDSGLWCGKRIVWLL